MRHFDSQKTSDALPWLALINALRRGFQLGCHAPVRQHHSFEISDEKAGSLLLMPAWTEDGYLGLKQVVVVPDNGKRGLSAVNASYQLSSSSTGKLLATIDGETLTHRRTAAASALASQYLSRANSEHLLMVGTGGMARSLIPAHLTVRPIKKVSIWGRNAEQSRKLADEISALGVRTRTVDDLDHAASKADIISCATLSESALVKGEHVRSGTHIDLVGAFTPTMRESDGLLIQKARVFVDTRDGALSEAGDILMAYNEGLFSLNDICASLRELCNSSIKGRETDDEITVFKSVGTALEDLYGAILVHQSES